LAKGPKAKLIGGEATHEKEPGDTLVGPEEFIETSLLGDV